MNNGEKSLALELKRHYEEIEKRVDYNTIRTYFLNNFNLFWDKLVPLINSKNISVDDFEEINNTLSFWLWYETRNRISEEIETIVFKVFLTESNYYLHTKDLDEDVIIEFITKEQIERRKSGSLELHQFLKEIGKMPTQSHSPNIVSYIKEEMNEKKYNEFYQEVASIIHRTISKQIIGKKFDLPFILLTLSGNSIEEIKKMMFGLVQKIEIYREREEEKKKVEETSTDSMIEKLITVIADSRTIAPSFKLLSERTGINEYLWKSRIINDAGFLEILKGKMESKYKQAKPSQRNDNKKYWGDVWVYWYKRIDNRIQKIEDKERNKLIKESQSKQRTKGKEHSFNKFKGKDYEQTENKPQVEKAICKSCHQYDAWKQGYCEDCFDVFGKM